MLRRTNVSLIVPLPLYKVAIVLIRQFSRPVVVQALNVANEYPQLRKGLIYVGWHHYKTSCQLHRVIWGAEQKAKDDSSTTTDDGQKTSSSSAEPKGNEKVSDSSSSSSSTTVISDKVAQKVKDERSATAAALANNTNATVGIGGLKQSADPVINITSPRTIKVLPGLRHGNFNPLKSVRNIFVAPPRPSDEELLKKGMQLVIEATMFLCVCGVILYEMKVSSADKRAKRILTEERFLRLESHIVHFPGCGCPEGAQDGQAPVDEHLDSGLAKLIPDRDKIHREWKEHHGSAPTTTTGNSNLNNKNNTTSSLTSSSSASTKSSDVSSSSSTSPVGNASSSPTSSSSSSPVSNSTTTINNNNNSVTVANNNSNQQQASTSAAAAAAQRRGAGQLARLPTSVTDLASIWCSLPIDVQIVVVAVFATPYFFMFALMLRLFTLVHRVQRQV